MLAQITGAPVVPIVYSVNRYWRLRPWGRLRILKAAIELETMSVKVTAR